MEIDSAAPTPPKSTSEPVPEVEVYLRLLILHLFLASPSHYSKAFDLAHQTVDKVQALSRRSMDPLGAKVWFAVERIYELSGELADARPYVPDLFSLQHKYAISDHYFLADYT